MLFVMPPTRRMLCKCSPLEYYKMCDDGCEGMIQKLFEMDANGGLWLGWQVIPLSAFQGMDCLR